MKVMIAKALALGSLCALFAGIGNIANAQDHHPAVHAAHHRVKKLQRVYAHAVHHGNTAAARRAHARAMAIRARLRAHRLHHG